MGRRRKVEYSRVITYATGHPGMRQADIAKHFHVSQFAISCILRSVGISGERHNGGRPPKRRPGQTAIEYEWEIKLHRLGLGMDRGATKLIVFGYDPVREDRDDSSATLAEVAD